MKKLILSFCLLFSALVRAEIDLTPYGLNENQIKVVRMFEERGKDEEFILKVIESFVKYNRRTQTTVYVPAHTMDDLLQIQSWAAGGAFAAFVSYTDLKFDNDTYKADCPSWEIFNFGRATNREFFKVDVLQTAISAATALQVAFQQDQSESKEQFKIRFLELAKVFKMEKYILD
ncbi:MAG: hypothetical protein Fur0010_06130 [Bdellovibrio sp.]